MGRCLIAYAFGNSKKKKRIEKETSRRYGEMRAALDECARASKIGFLDSTVKRPTTVIRASEGRPAIVQRPSDGRPTAVRQPSDDCPTAVRTTVRRHAHSAFWIPESPLGNLHPQFLFRPPAGGLLVIVMAVEAVNYSEGPLPAVNLAIKINLCEYFLVLTEFIL